MTRADRVDVGIRRFTALAAAAGCLVNPLSCISGAAVLGAVTVTDRLPDLVLRRLGADKILRIRAGNDHRFIGIWVVVVEGRAFVRSWSISGEGWYRAFMADPRGAIQLGTRVIRIRTVPVRGERLQGSISAAYLAKYATPGSRKYAVDLGRAKCRATTLELRPAVSLPA